MHIYFSGIGGAAIGPLAMIAHQAGYTVSGSDKQHSAYIDYLRKQGITNIHIGQDYADIAAVHAARPIDWFVYTSALPMEQPNAPELAFCAVKAVKATKRDVFLGALLKEKQLKMLAIAGTHGKTTTTALIIWLMKQLGRPVSYSVGAKLSFGDMGEYNSASEFFIYEADEFDRNFLSFWPYLSIITGIDWDHPDIYPTKAAYDQAFVTFLSQSGKIIMWRQDADQLAEHSAANDLLLTAEDPAIDRFTLPGRVNRLDAWQAVHAVHSITKTPLAELIPLANAFPGVSRRFEKIAPHLYSDYSHTPPKIRGALQLAQETAGDNVVILYEGLHNTRQHFIKDDLKHIFDHVKQLYIVPSYLAREDASLALLSPEALVSLLSPAAQKHTATASLNEQLLQTIQTHIQAGDTAVALSAGGGGSLDEWLRKSFATAK